MCIRDSYISIQLPFIMKKWNARIIIQREWFNSKTNKRDKDCLLYTSDAADERSSVDLGGRRIIKKKKDRNTDRARVDTQKEQL